MRYWDTSALVPLLFDEPGTALARGWLESDPEIVTWGGSRLELVNAVERRAREGRLTTAQRRKARALADELFAAVGEVTDLLAVRARALPLVARHPLRTADALQLGAALVAGEGDAAAMPFVCLDRPLAAVAEREGFPLLSWPDEP